MGLAVFIARGVPAQEHMDHMPEAERWHASVAGAAFLQYDHTFQTRGAYHVGSLNRVMLHAGGPWGGAGGTLAVRVMGSAEPLTLGDRGAPQLLQVAFTNGGQTVTDRSHPSPWIMELAGSYERPLAAGVDVSLYGAAIGEPALGPPVYLHRGSAATNPVVPLGHHAQDDAHSSFGVVTFGARVERLRLEMSAFNDRQPDDPGTVFFYQGARLDAYATRATVMAGAGWSLFASYGFLPATGGGHTHDSQHRVSAGGLLTAPGWSVTIAYGGSDPVGSARLRHTLLVEAEHRLSSADVVFGRAEYVQRTAEELSLVGSINATQDVEAVQVGYGRTVVARRATTVRVGAHATLNIVPPALVPFYGSRAPFAIAVFGQLTRS